MYDMISNETAHKKLKKYMDEHAIPHNESIEYVTVPVTLLENIVDELQRLNKKYFDFPEVKE